MMKNKAGTLHNVSRVPAVYPFQQSGTRVLRPFRIWKGYLVYPPCTRNSKRVHDIPINNLPRGRVPDPIGGYTPAGCGPRS